MYVDSTETDGLPVLTKQENVGEEIPSDFGGWASISRMLSSWRGRRARGDKTLDRVEEEGNQPIRNTKEDTDFFNSRGSGILSALLGIYDPRDSSETPSPHATDAEAPKPKSKLKSKEENKPKPSTSSLPSRPRFSRDFSLTNVLEKMSHNDVLEKTRSDAGVFGPLITATGNIAGVAAPILTSVAPDPTQSGHRLSRYSHVEDGRQTPRSTPSSRRPSITIESAHSTPIEEKADGGTPDSPRNGRGSAQKRKGWTSALKALTPVGSHDSPYTTDTEGDVANEKNRKRKKTKRKREDIFVRIS